MPSAALSNQRESENAHQKQQFEGGKQPLVVGIRERQVGDATDDGQRGEQEAGRHAAAVDIGQAGRYTIGPGEASQYRRADSLDKGAVLSRQAARTGQQWRGAAGEDGVRRLVGLRKVAEFSAQVIRTEQGLYAPVRVAGPAA